MEITQSDLIKAIHRSQHCQRNWDLSKSIPDEDMEVLITAATQCPSKQNIAFYKIHFITNRDIIESIHAKTEGFTTSYNPYKATTNSQTLANLLIVIEQNDFLESLKSDIHRSDESRRFLETGIVDKGAEYLWKRDTEMAVGIAAGYLNITASLMGYSTGCCACFDGPAIKEILGLEKEPVLLMGIGFKNPELNRRIHHADHSFIFPTKIKQPIPVNRIK
jgi:nitroreductase